MAANNAGNSPFLVVARSKLFLLPRYYSLSQQQHPTERERHNYTGPNEIALYSSCSRAGDCGTWSTLQRWAQVNPIGIFCSPRDDVHRSCVDSSCSSSSAARIQYGCVEWIWFLWGDCSFVRSRAHLNLPQLCSVDHDLNQYNTYVCMCLPQSNV